MKKYVDELIGKTKVDGRKVKDNYWNELLEEISQWLKSEHSKEDEEKLYREAYIERVFMSSDYSDK